MGHYDKEREAYTEDNRPQATRGGRMIKLARGARGYSREELAERTGYAPNTLYNWEQKGVKVAYDDVYVIAKYLHFSIHELEEMLDAA